MIGGAIAAGLSWRYAFVFQALIVGTIILLSRRVVDPVAPDPERPFDAMGAILSAVGMLFVVFGILEAGNNNALLVISLAIGVAFLIGFFFIRSRERKRKEPMLSTDLSRTAPRTRSGHPEPPVAAPDGRVVRRLGVPHTERHHSAFKAGVIFTAATLGVLTSSLAAVRVAKRYMQKTLIAAGFRHDRGGIGLLLGLVKLTSSGVRRRTRVSTGDGGPDADCHRPTRATRSHQITLEGS